MKKNGKIIRCKTCGKERYISGSRVGKRFYCSTECARKDNFGFRPKEKVCIICSKRFLVKTGIETQRKTCSFECWKANNYAISKRRSAEKTIKKCVGCGEVFVGLKNYNTKGFCKKCQYSIFKKTRIGKGNPNFRNGEYTHANFQGRKSKKAYKHLNECSRYKKEFLKKTNIFFASCVV